MPLKTLVVILFLAFVVPSTQAQFIQSQIDVAACFPRLLQDTRVNLSYENVKLAALSVWSYETYNSLKASGKLPTVIDEIPADASFDVATVAVQKMFRKNQLNFDREAWSGTWASKLNPDAKDIVSQCIDAQLRTRWGLSSEYRIMDQWKVKLFLYWNWPNSTKLVLNTLRLENATVENAPDPYKLLPYTHEKGCTNKPLLSQSGVCFIANGRGLWCLTEQGRIHPRIETGCTL